MAEADRHAKTRPRDFIETLEAMILDVPVGLAPANATEFVAKLNDELRRTKNKTPTTLTVVGAF
jgi:hypothetical protein